MTVHDRAEPDAPEPELEPLAELARLLRLHDAGVAITAARMLGSGTNAVVELDLSNGETIEAERAGALYSRTGMAAWIAFSTGIDAGAITKRDAERACALIRRSATIAAELRTSDLGRGHGIEFLRDAPVEAFTLNDQADRYRAFAKLDRLDPAGAVPYERPEPRTIARSSLVLLDRAAGWRFVIVGHLFAFVRAAGLVAYPGELARRMLAAGWERQGKRGDIKATPRAPGSRPIRLAFWRIPPEWEELGDA